MQNHSMTWRARRALQLALAALGATVAIVLLSAHGAGAQVTISKTDITIESTGDAKALTGRNDLVGNDSVNTTKTAQTGDTSLDGRVIPNISDETNSSDGSASLETGSAEAVGNASVTVAAQAISTGSDAATAAAAVGNPGGPPPTSPLVAIDEALPHGATQAAGSTGSTGGLQVGDQGGPVSGTAPSSGLGASAQAQLPSSGVTPFASPPSTGPAAADTGMSAMPVMATGPLDNTVLGAVSGAGPPGVTVTDQAVHVVNDGDALATTGENTVADGDVLTGDATATGNISQTSASQAIVATGDLNLVDQATKVTNDGEGRADTGNNEISGGSLVTGSATATGNISKTASKQLTMATGDLNLVDQAIDVSNVGTGIAETGHNKVEDGEVATGDATATGNRSDTALGQRVIVPPSSGFTNKTQDIVADNLGDALADTGRNKAVAGADGSAVIDTGNALAIGNMARLIVTQDA
jgi:hypothetical protein